MTRCLCTVLAILGSAVPLLPVRGDDALARLRDSLVGRIVWETYRQDNWELYIANADGSDPVNLTQTPDVDELYPHVSPDGTRVCFVMDEGEGDAKTRTVYYMNLDGAGRTLVARNARQPCWSPDGAAIAYLGSEFDRFSYLDYATKGLFFYDLETKQHTQHPNEKLHHLYNICWSPDGKWFVATVHAGMGVDHALLAIEAEGPGVFNLGINGCRPELSPDGKRIVWVRSDQAISVADIDLTSPTPRATNPRDLITSSKPTKVYHADWSPDGTLIAFSRGPTKKTLRHAPEIVGIKAAGWDICVAEANGAGAWVAITSGGNSNKEPDWVPAKHAARAQMVLIPGGWFEMGSELGEPDETPVHRVRIDAFHMDRCEVTQAQYAKLMLANPSHFKGLASPVEQVSWAAAARYCNARSRAEGLETCYDEDTAECDVSANGYRLPTEAEWEYACRAGAATRYSFGDDAGSLADHGWHAANSRETTHPVGEKEPNPWGLYDMHGNVAEWCNDIYDAAYYAKSPPENPRGPVDGDRFIIRGGAWNTPAGPCRSACRLTANPGFQDPCFRRDDIGFRCVQAAR